MNKYDLDHVCTAHPRMSRSEWERAYTLAWQHYYTFEHIETILRRVASVGANASNALFLCTWFKGSIEFEKMHPLEGGFLRLKFRRDRRPGRMLEPMWRFYPRYASEVIGKLVRWAWLYLRLRRIYIAIKRDTQRFGYSDLAMTPVSDDEVHTHELFRTDAAQAFVGQQQRLEKARHNAPVQ
jgi:hypothetical protein